MAKVGLFGLDPYVRRELTEAFADELMRTGFDAHWAPSKRGVALESLIDLVCINDDPRLNPPLISSE